MNITKLVVFVTAMSGLTACAQSKTPTSVTSSFNQKFPHARDVEWEKESKTEWEAEFKLDEKECSANFTAEGEWLETESPMSFNTLPEKVQTAFNAAHPQSKLKEAAKIETSKGITKYEIEYKKGLKTKEVFYTENGNEIKE